MRHRAQAMPVAHYLGIGALVIATWLLWDTWATWPIQLFVVFVHECGHALAALLTGGEVRGMQIQENLGGVTSTVGGIPLLILPAGYIASALFGAGLILAAADPRNARTTMKGLAVFSLGFGLVLVRPIFALGLPFAIGSAAVFALLAFKASRVVNEWVLYYLAIVSALYSVIDIKEDLLHWHTTRITDATMLADRTLIPAPVWGALFAVIAIALLAAALRRVLRS